jgi:hypothetical protein
MFDDILGGEKIREEKTVDLMDLLRTADEEDDSLWGGNIWGEDNIWSSDSIWKS